MQLCFFHDIFDSWLVEFTTGTYGTQGHILIKNQPLRGTMEAWRTLMFKAGAKEGS